MMKKIIIIYSIISFLILLILFYYFIYNVYGVIIKKNPDNLYTDQSETMKIEVVPVNALGTKALFRSSSAHFEIIEGKELIEIVYQEEAKGILIIRSVGKIGTVGIKIETIYSLLPEYVEINIQPLTA